jgi:hypothetical protein
LISASTATKRGEDERLLDVTKVLGSGYKPGVYRFFGMN